MAKILETDRPDPEALDQMRRISGRESGDGEPGEWFAYQNHDLGHPGLGHLKFLRCGEGCTFGEPPRRLPDTPSEINWRYFLVGKVNLDTGEIEEVPKEG
jgi:hypothetical protein